MVNLTKKIVKNKKPILLIANDKRVQELLSLLVSYMSVIYQSHVVSIYSHLMRANKYCITAILMRCEIKLPLALIFPSWDNENGSAVIAVFYKNEIIPIILQYTSFGEAYFFTSLLSPKMLS